MMLLFGFQTAKVIKQNRQINGRPLERDARDLEGDRILRPSHNYHCSSSPFMYTINMWLRSEHARKVISRGDLMRR